MTSETIIQCFEIQLPFKYLKEALETIERDENSAFTRKCILPTLKQEINLTFANLHAHLKITFDRLPFSLSDGIYKCIINSIEDDISPTTKELKEQYKSHNDTVESVLNSTKSQNHTQQEDIDGEETKNKCEGVSVLQRNISDAEIVSPITLPTVKRKRGRPKKVKCLLEKGAGSPDCLNSTTSKGSENLCMPDTEEKIGESLKKTDTDVNFPAKRYGLRGRKLNSKLMALVKSAGIDGDDSDNGSLSLSDSGSDEESNRFKKKNRKVNNHHVDYKENRSYSKKLKEQVQEILSEGVVSEIIKQTRGKIVECKMCGKKLYGYINIYKHVLKVHRKTAAQDEYLKEISKLKECSCSFCGETFIDSSSMNNHKETAHKDLDFPCPLCDYKRSNLSNLRMHVRNMHVDIGKKAFCHLCTASFRSHGSLRQHIDLIHYGNKYVKCDTCKKQFYNKSQLRRHMKSHGSDLAKKFTCTTCGKCFNFEYNLKRHISAIHQPQSESFHCSYCGKGFSQKIPMITHVQLVHFNIFPYSCKECKTSFIKAPLLKEHMMSVHHIKDFQVPVVPKNSVYDKSEEDKFYCSYCSESFTHKIRLIEHVHGDHSDAFPYKCDSCVQGFLEQSYLKLHKLKAHGELLQNDDILPQTKSAGEIMQIITTKNGYPNKVMSAISGTEIVPESEETFQDNQAAVITDDTDSQDNFSTNIVQNVPQHSSSSLVVEVAQGSNTYQYVIEAPESIGHSELAMQDIANLLLAAGKTSDEDQVNVLDVEPSSVQEISLVIDDNTQTQISTVENQAQPVEILLGQNEQNISLVSADNQNQPMEIVIDQNEQNSEVFTIENQAHALQIEHGDIIELNDSNSVDGKNYYRIINVLDNHS